MPSQILNSLRTYMRGDGAVLLPEMQLFLFAIGALIMDRWATDKSKYWNPALAIAGTAFSAFTLWMLRARILQSGDLTGFHQTVILDSFFIFFAALLLIATALVILLSVNHPAIRGIRQGRFYALLLFATTSMMLMVSGIDLLVIFLAVEAASISCYFLGAAPGISSRPAPAVIRFLVSGALGSAILVYGFSLLYGLSGTLNVSGISSALVRRHNVANAVALSHQSGARAEQMLQLLQSRLPEALHFHPFMIQALSAAAFTMVIVGLFLKFRATSSHRSARTDHSAIPAVMAVYLSGASVVAMVAILLRLLLTVFADSQPMWWRVLAVVATIMIACGTIASLRTKNLEHLLGFSTLAQIGTVLFALVAANEAALTAISYYAATYLFILSGAYAVLVVLRHGIGAAPDGRKDLSDLHGLRQRSPLVALLFIIFLLALCGLPPTAGFFGRYFIFRALLETGHRYLAWFFVASALPLAYSYLRVAAHLWRSEPQQKPPQLTLGIPEAIVLGICVFVSLAAGLYSEPFMRVARYAFGQ